ncbi:hypothetical protein BASA81_008035 [Batrachochytrium salamandrivorans]|nr:hypothetical protein BASA81_008035 [Batrachochytrium salamandrivorans]
MARKRQHLELYPSMMEFRGNEWQLFPKRLTELVQRSQLSHQEMEEKRLLLKTAFPTWTRRDFFLFLYYFNHGQRTIREIAQLMPSKRVEEVVQYSTALLERGREAFGLELWQKVKLFLSNSQDEIFEWQWKIKRRLVEMEHVNLFGNVRNHLLGGGGEDGDGRLLEEDCFFLQAFLNRKSAVQVKQDIALHPAFALDHFVRSQTAKELERNVEALIEHTAHNRAEGEGDVGEEAPDEEGDLGGPGEEDYRLQERERDLGEELEWLERTLYHHAKSLFSPLSTNSPPSRDEDGDSDGGGGGGSGGGNGPGNNIISLDSRHHAQVLSVVLSLGTAGMSMLVNQVIKVLPEGSISKRQLKRDILCLAVKEKRAGDRAARWYARTDV